MGQASKAGGVSAAAEPQAKLCIDKLCERGGKRLPLPEFYRSEKMADGRQNYCKECAKRRTIECRRRNYDNKKAEKAAKRAQGHAEALERKRNQLAKVQSEIATGPRTRDQLHESTQLDYDTLGDVLARLWDEKIVKIERVHGDRFFVAA